MNTNQRPGNDAETDDDEIVSPEEDLVARILELTKSPQSVPYYKKALATLGWSAVDEELGELRYQLNGGRVESPARYFTSLLQKRFDSLARLGPVPGAPATGSARPAPLPRTSAPKPQAPPAFDQETYHTPTALDLFSELRPRTNTGEGGEESAMDQPFSSKTLPWATFIGPDFFTLSTNKAKSDRIMAKFRMHDGKVAEVPLYRGRFFPKDEDRGILTSEEGRILGAMECFWVEQGCRYAKFENGSVSCFCRVPLRELARLIGWESFGGKDLTFLKRKAVNLKVKGYYLELDSIPEFRDAGLKGYGFSLVDGFDVMDKVRHRLEETTLRVRFSDPFSRQLLARRVVSRPKELLTIRSELAFLLRLYLEPILMSRRTGEGHSIELLNLVRLLNLPAAGWHKLKSQRKAIFGKALHELQGMKTTDGKTLDIQIEQGQNANDFMLVARLRTSPLLPKQ